MNGITDIITYLKENKEQITSEWIMELGKKFPGLNNPTVYKMGLAYFDLITDIHIPIENHPVRLTEANGWLSCILNRHTTFTDVLDSIRLWKELIRKTICSCCKTVPLEVFDIFVRIDSFEREISFKYFDQYNERIDQLHDDRLNLLGKLAASMAHEIRNPLTAIEGFLKLIRTHLSAEQTDKVARYFDIVQTEFDALKMQVTGFLSFSKKVDEEAFCPVDIADMVDTTLTLITPRLINENVSLETAIQTRQPMVVQKIAIQQVLSNLLNNSIDALSLVNYAKRITVSACEHEDHYAIHISNNGPKIAEEVESKLFTPFITNKSHGTGLGLVICKQIMTKNNGDISFRSTEEETTFTLTIYKKADQLPA